MKPDRKMTAEEALVRLETLCARSEQCSGEIMTRLARWKFGPDEARRILDSLVDRRFVDDRRYASAFVRDKYRFARWGRLKIRQALALKRVGRDVISDAIGEIDEDLYRETLAGLLRAKARTLADGNTFEGRTRLFRFAVSRGFESEIISSCIRNEQLWPESSAD